MSAALQHVACSPCNEGSRRCAEPSARSTAPPTSAADSRTPSVDVNEGDEQISSARQVAGASGTVRTCLAAVALACMAVVLPGCSGSGRAAPTAQGRTPLPATTPASPGRYDPSVKVVPKRKLHNGQRVTVRGEGFPPVEQLGILECGRVSDPMDESSCDLRHLALIASDDKGRVSGVYTVTLGPFGANRVVCSKRQPCHLTVRELLPKTPIHAVHAISFR
jgi:hypothetical protein